MNMTYYQSDGRLVAMKNSNMRDLLEKSISITKERLAVFDNDHQEFKEDLFSDLEVGYSVLSRYFNKKPHETTTESETQSALLLWKSLNSLICVYQSLRLGFYDEPMSIGRTALENVLIPETLQVHQERLKQAGFKQSTVWFQCFNFVSILSFK